MAAKKKTAAKNLGTATGVAEAREKKGGTYMHEQAEEDANEAKLGEAAKEVKRCHLLCREASARLAAARMSTSTPDAIEHDLDRARVLAGQIEETASEALRLLPR